MSSLLRLAVWSGPRNVSTALMRSFDARPDTLVCDEPLYAHYLAATGRRHPLADEIVAAHEADWRRVVERLTGPVAPGAGAGGAVRVFYQKHMAHHLLPEIDRGWLARLTNAFLIREPRAMVRSLARKLGPVRLEDTGLPQQVALFEAERERTGAVPVVIDSRDLLTDPRVVLERLCARVEIEFTDAMLSWEPGPRPTDGCWGPYWYDNTLRSTGFAPHRDEVVDVPPELASLVDECEALYECLHVHRLRA